VIGGPAADAGRGRLNGDPVPWLLEANAVARYPALFGPSGALPCASAVHRAPSARYPVYVLSRFELSGARPFAACVAWKEQP
jgi:hypothetical protein